LRIEEQFLLPVIKSGKQIFARTQFLNQYIKPDIQQNDTP